MKILALSYLYPNSKYPECGIFVHNRLKFINEICIVKVLAPVKRYFFLSYFFDSAKADYKFSLSNSGKGLVSLHPEFKVFPKIFKFFDSISYYSSVKSTIKVEYSGDFPFDLIDVHWTYPDIFAAYRLARIYRKPFIVTVRGKEALYPEEFNLRKLILNFCLRRADHVVALSAELAAQVEKVGVNREKIDVVLNGVDSDVFQFKDRGSARKSLGLSRDKKIILSVGRLTAAKGHQDTINAMKVLSGRHDLELHIIGGHNQESDFSRKLTNMVDSLGLNNVFFYDGLTQKELALWYSAADIFCLVSRGEGCPNVVLEALACGTPSIVTNVGAVSEMIAENVNGNIVKDINKLSNILDSALRKEWDRRRISIDAKAFSWETCARKIVGIYEQTLAGIGRMPGN